MTAASFWNALDRLAAESRLVIDRPRGSAHPRYPDLIYPFDYGCLADTRAMDGGGIAVWLGSLPGRQVTAVICAVDLDRHGAEIKLLLGCTPQEAQIILQIHNDGNQSGLLIVRGDDHDLPG